MATKNEVGTEFKTPPPEWAVKVGQSLLNESDRGCILIGVALLDETLEALIRSALRQEPTVKKKSIDPLFKSAGPLNSLSHRINMAFALGLITPEVRDDLNTLRKLRNEVAHLYGPTSFQDERIRSMLRALKIAPTLTNPIPKIKNKCGFSRKQSEGDRRKVFIERTCFIIGLIDLNATMKGHGEVFKTVHLTKQAALEAIIDRIRKKQPGARPNHALQPPRVDKEGS